MKKLPWYVCLIIAVITLGGAAFALAGWFASRNVEAEFKASAEAERKALESNGAALAAYQKLTSSSPYKMEGDDLLSSVDETGSLPLEGFVATTNKLIVNMINEMGDQSEFPRESRIWALNPEGVWKDNGPIYVWTFVGRKVSPTNDYYMEIFASTHPISTNNLENADMKWIFKTNEVIHVAKELEKKYSGGISAPGPLAVKIWPTNPGEGIQQAKN